MINSGYRFACGWLLLANVAALLIAGEPWPEFRGPTGDGHTTADLPVEWGPEKNVAWRTPIRGKAWSSPVVWGDQIWVTTAPEDGKKLYALGLDAQSGKVLHDVEVFDNPFPQYCIERNSYASSTPVIEEGRLYVHYGSHGTACVDTASGKVLWSRRDLPCFHHRGAASSPILHENRLFLTFDGFDLQYVVALDKQTGKTLWKQDRNIEYGTDNGDAKKAYGTPSVIQVGGRDQLISPSAGAAIAYDPETGEELWRVKAGGMNVSARPLFADGVLYLSTADGGFVHYAINPDGAGDITGSHVLWKNTKGVPKHASHVLVDGLLFMANEQGVMSCVEAKSGEVIWQKRLGGSFTASPITSRGRLYFFDEDGKGYVLAAGRSYEELAVNELPEGCMASPAVLDNSIIIRTTAALYRVQATP